MYRSTFSWPRQQMVIGQFQTLADLTPKKGLPVPSRQEVVWTPESVWTLRKSENFWLYWDSNYDRSPYPVAIPTALVY
jgi:hypothetical protein